MKKNLKKKTKWFTANVVLFLFNMKCYYEKVDFFMRKLYIISDWNKYLSRLLNSNIV